MPRRLRTPAIVTTVLLVAAIVAILVMVRGDHQPAQERFLGCVRRIGPDSFSLAVSRVMPGDPLRIETYGLVGSGGLILTDHVDHTIEVVGRLEATGDAFPRLHVSSARHVATFCWKP
jgi:hypothetical protein